MARSIKKGPYVEEKLLKKVERMNLTGDRRPIKTWSRRSMIVPDFVGNTIAIHNGRAHISIFITENIVGHRLPIVNKKIKKFLPSGAVAGANSLIRGQPLINR